jgi:hypothetical protein
LRPHPTQRIVVEQAAALQLGRITEAEGNALAKKPNYDFEKRRKELDRKQKKDAKRDERLLRKRNGGDDAADGAPEGAEDGGDVADEPAGV